MTRTIAIASGKGGVGKSIISLNLAVLLADLDRRTCLFDADLGLANVNVLLGLYPVKTLEDVALQNLPLREIIIRTPNGMDLIPGSSGLEEMADLEAGRTERLIQDLAGLDGYDYLLFDTSAGLHRHVLSFCLAAQETILIVTPEPTSLVDAFALLKVLVAGGLGRPVRVIINQCPDKEAARQTFLRFKKAALEHLRAEVHPLGVVFEDPSVEKAVKRQQPLVRLYPRTAAARCLKIVADRLEQKPPGISVDSDLREFWTRWFDLVSGVIEIRPQAELSPAAVPKKRDAPEVEIDPACFSPLELPCRPDVLLAVLKLVDKEENAASLPEVISLDPALAFNVLIQAESMAPDPGMNPLSLKWAIKLLGSAVLGNIAASMAVHLSWRPESENLWPRLWELNRHALKCAVISRLVSRLGPDLNEREALAAGLLHDLGQTVLLAGRAEGADHARLGAELFAHYGLSPLAADAVRYHHHPLERIQEALPLVKAVYLADALSRGPGGRGLGRLLDLSEATMAELQTAAETEVRQKLAGLETVQFGLEGPDWTKSLAELREEVRCRALQDGFWPVLVRTSNAKAAARMLLHGLSQLFGLRRSLLFWFSRKREGLICVAAYPVTESNSSGQMIISVKSGGSLLVKTLLSNQTHRTGRDETNLSLADEQILRLLGEDFLYCLPLVAPAKPLGVIAVGVDRLQAERLETNRRSLSRFTRQAASIIHDKKPYK
ncbi:MAG: HDOD domain-containing protein [Thermodesulfobacteriota bacterium]